MISQATAPVSGTSSDPFDLFVIGGGINGTGIARDAAGRGLSVCLTERGDLAQGTSSASTKLIHGGLRYLEFYEFRLVREALHEREVLLNAAPHIIWPMEFVLPHAPGLRPPWMVRLGLFLYDHLARRKRLAKSYEVDLRQSRFGRPLKSFVKSGFVYSDCWAEDSRLVAITAQDAALHGAEILTYTDFTSAVKQGDLWRITLESVETPPGGSRATEPRTIYARHIVNATGPRLHKVAERITGADPQPTYPLRLVKGSHIIVPRLYDGEHAYILQHDDRRMVFVIPFEDHYSLIGTTDQQVTEEDDIDKPRISESEKLYLLQAANRYFTHQMNLDDIKHTYSGIRPLFDAGGGEQENMRVSRDYMMTLHDGCLTIHGGKITTFRRLAAEAVDCILAERGDKRPQWTHKAALPGGDFTTSLAVFTQGVIENYPFLPEEMAERLASHYGTRIHTILRGASRLEDLGRSFGHTLYAAEVDYLMAHEWARKPDDILLRRTRIGMEASEASREALAAYMAEKLAAPA